MRHRQVTELLGLWTHQGVWNHGKPPTWVKGSLCSFQEFESLVEVTAAIPGIRMHSPGFGEEGREGEGQGEAASAMKGPFVSSG